MNDQPEKFSQYLVIFVDILGSQSRTDFQEMYQINTVFHDEFMKNQENDRDYTLYFRKIYTFSDCAYIFYGFKDDTPEEKKDLGKMFTTALCNCEPIFLRFLKERIMFRGGISYGNAYIDPNRNMFFGDAVTKAYQMESKEAVHPRILVDSFVAQEIEDNIVQKTYELATTNPKIMIALGSGMIPYIWETGAGIVEHDLDGHYVFNYLHFPENNTVMPGCYLSGYDFMKELMSYCQEQIEKNSSYKVIDKYFYLMRFVQSKLDNLPERSEL